MHDNSRAVALGMMTIAKIEVLERKCDIYWNIPIIATVMRMRIAASSK